MAFLKSGFDGVIRVSDGAFIPRDVTNSDWQRYLAWISEGNSPVDISEPPIDEKKKKWAEIQDKRDHLTQTGGYLLDGYWFHSDAYSLSQQQGLILAAMQVQSAGGDMDVALMPTPWKIMGGARVAISARFALRLLPAAMAQQGMVFDAAEAHREAMEASADPASYDFSYGWPKVFGT